MKILFIIDNLNAGGKERQLVEIIKGLKIQKEFKIGVITFNKNCHYTDSVKNDVDFFVELKKRPTRLEPLFTIWGCFKRFNPDIVHTWDSLSAFYSFLPCKLYRKKTINGSIRDAGVDKGLLYYFKRFFLKRADLVLANSEAGLLNYRINGKVLYNAIDLNRFKGGESNNLFNIVMVANFTEYKDHQTFINASIKLIQDKIVDNVFLIGGGKLINKYKRIIPVFLKERFIFTGSVKNVESFLAKCKVGILCSTKKYNEGISNSILEYLAAGLIVIATDSGGTKEIIIDNYNGYLVEPGNEKKLYEKIKFVKDNYNKLGFLIDNAQEVLKVKFDYSRNIAKLIKIYKDLQDNN